MKIADKVRFNSQREGGRLLKMNSKRHIEVVKLPHGWLDLIFFVCSYDLTYYAIEPRLVLYRRNAFGICGNNTISRQTL